MTKQPKPPPDLWERLDREYAKVFPGVPAGAFTIREFATRYGISYHQAETRILKLCAGSKLSPVGNFGIKQARHYIFKEKP